MTNEISTTVEDVYRSESRRVFATLIRLLGDFDLAEEMMHEAFTAAIERWPIEGIPVNPRAWLVSTARFKGIDRLRRLRRFDESQRELARSVDQFDANPTSLDDEAIHDDQLRLIFTCCHPALSSDVQIALTLREVCGLTTDEIAFAFLTLPSTIAQRIVRGKAKIRSANIPYVVPTLSELPSRLDSVLAVIYLVFNEGYSASFGESVTRPLLSSEAIRLGRLLTQLMPDTEVLGLLALMVLHESRRAARSSPTGDIILLEDQNRTLWNQAFIAEGKSLVERALASGPVGIYSIQAAISAVHAEAGTASETDWSQIVALYDLLLSAESTPIIELNRAVAVAMRDGPDAGLRLIDELLKRGELVNYHLAYAARADLLRRMDRLPEAHSAYLKSLSMATQEPERRFLERRISEISEKL